MFEGTKAFSSFSVDDVGRAKQFYGQTLGLDVAEKMGGLELHFPNGTTVFAYAKEDHRPATFTVLNLPVDDITRAHDELTKRGVRFDYRNDPELGTDEKGIHWGGQEGDDPNIAWFTDPAGNILSVIEQQ